MVGEFAPCTNIRMYLCFELTNVKPTLFGFDSSPDSLTPSTSYYVQRMFSTNRGDTILPVNTTATYGPLYWVASRTNSTYFVKLANYGPKNQSVRVKVPQTKTGHVEMLYGSQNATNFVHNITVQPTVKNVTSSRGTYAVDMPPWGVAVLSVS